MPNEINTPAGADPGAAPDGPPDPPTTGPVQDPAPPAQDTSPLPDDGSAGDEAPVPDASPLRDETPLPDAEPGPDVPAPVEPEPRPDAEPLPGTAEGTTHGTAEPTAPTAVADTAPVVSPWAPPAPGAIAVAAPAPTGAAPPATAPCGPAPSGVTPRPRWWLTAVAVLGVVMLVGGLVVWFVADLPGPGPQQLATQSVTSDTVALTWSPPKAGAAERYVVRRDGVEVARIPAQPSFGNTGYYQDGGLTPRTAYRYTVLAIVHGKLSEPTADLVVHTRPAPPQGLTSSGLTTSSVRLTWSAPPGSAPDSYIVRRDGGDLATLSGSTRTYQDSSLVPLAAVSYTVVAVYAGERSDPTASVDVTPPAPPVGDAHFQGAWDTTLTVTDNAGTLLKVGDTLPETWSFVARCVTGPCPADLSGTLAGFPFKVALTRSGASYHGSVDAQITRCNNVRVTNTITVDLKVTDGRMDGRTWRVSRWAGNLALSSPYTTAGNYYCPSHTVRFSVRPEAPTTQPNT